MKFDTLASRTGTGLSYQEDLNVIILLLQHLHTFLIVAENKASNPVKIYTKTQNLNEKCRN